MSTNAAPHAICSDWRGLARAGAVAALVAGIVFRRNWGAEYVLLHSLGAFPAGPDAIPVAAADWFALIAAHPVIALVMLNIVDAANYLLVGLLYLGLYGALRDIRRGATTLALASGLLGVALYLSATPSLALFGLGRRFAARPDPALVSAAEALLAIENGGTVGDGLAVHLALLFVTLAGLLFALAMRRDPRFSRGAAPVGIIAHALGLCVFPALALGLPPAVLAIPYSLSAPFLLAWYLIVGLRLLRLPCRRR